MVLWQPLGFANQREQSTDRLTTIDPATIYFGSQLGNPPANTPRSRQYQLPLEPAVGGISHRKLTILKTHDTTPGTTNRSSTRLRGRCKPDTARRASSGSSQPLDLTTPSIQDHNTSRCV